MANKFKMSVEELQERQHWTLDQKIDHSLGTIENFYNHMDGNVYVSFSGGKDSTILLWLARKIYPDIRACFCNTGNEYPDIVYFVRKKQKELGNIDIIHPKLSPKAVLGKYGFPLISKEVSNKVHKFKTNPNTIIARQIVGELGYEGNFERKIPNKHKWLLYEDFKTSNYCCDKLKKAPFHKYEKETGLAPILGTMASESHMRQTSYLLNGGCNVFDESNPLKSRSMPLSIWLEDDVWNCIEKYNIEISDIYAKGVNRTGCMFCGYGCQFKDDVRMEIAYKYYPKFYQMFMKYENNGVPYRVALRKVLERNGLSLPDEPVGDLFSSLDKNK